MEVNDEHGEPLSSTVEDEEHGKPCSSIDEDDEQGELCSSTDEDEEHGKTCSSTVKDEEHGKTCSSSVEDEEHRKHSSSTDKNDKHGKLFSSIDGHEDHGKPCNFVIFPPSLHNAEILLTLTKKPCILPDGGGQKDSAPDESCKAKIDRFYEELETVLSEERVCKIGSLSNGTWIVAKSMVRVDKACGPHWQRFGFTVDGVSYALPEEALFLLEQGLLEIYCDGLPLSMQQAWMLLTRHLPSMEYYHTFTHLCRLGFAVVRSDIEGLKAAVRSRGLSDNVVNANASILSEQKIPDPLLSTPYDAFSGRLDAGSMLVNPVCTEYKSNIATDPEEMLVDDEASKNSDDRELTSSLEEDEPLLSPTDAISVEAVLSKLQIIKSRPIPQISNQQPNSPLYLNVYQKTSGFKKSNPGKPDYKVAVFNYNDPPPNVGELDVLRDEARDAPLKLAVCNRGTVTFYAMINADVSMTLGNK